MTTFELACHPQTPTCFYGMLMYPIEKFAQVIQAADKWSTESQTPKESLLVGATNMPKQGPVSRPPPLSCSP